MAVKPKNAEKDSWAYTLPHEIGFLIQELAQAEGDELKLPDLSTSDYLERLVRQLAEQKLTPERRADARRRHEERVEERMKKFQAQQAAKSARVP